MKSILKSTSLIIAITFLFFSISTAQSKIEVTIGLSYYKKADRSKIAVALIKKKENGKFVFAKNAKVNFYVQRLFGFMPASEENTITTDEKGQATFAFPKNISGDTAGLITIAARLEDNENFGNLENKATQSWGTILPIIKEPFPRALFEPHAPWPLVVTVSTLFGGVWLIYFFIFFQLGKIKKEGQLKINDSTPQT